MMMSVLYNINCEDLEETKPKTDSQGTRIRTISQSVDSGKGLANNASSAYYDGKDVYLSHSSQDLSKSMGDCRICKNKWCNCSIIKKQAKVRRTQSCGTNSLSSLASKQGKIKRNPSQRSACSDLDDTVFSDSTIEQKGSSKEGRDNSALDLKEEENDCLGEQSSVVNSDALNNSNELISEHSHISHL